MKRQLLKICLLAAVASLVASGCDSAGEDVSAAVDEVFAEYEASLLAGDAEGWVAQWTDDGVAMWPGFPVISGRSAMLEALQNDFEFLTYTEFTISTEEVERMGDWAYAWGTFTYTFEVKDGGETVSFDGKFLTVFQQQSDGSWRIHRDASNSNVP